MPDLSERQRSILTESIEGAFHLTADDKDAEALSEIGLCVWKVGTGNSTSLIITEEGKRVLEGME